MINISKKSILYKVEMYLAGYNEANLPKDTCALIWQAILLPILIVASFPYSFIVLSLKGGPGPLVKTALSLGIFFLSFVFGLAYLQDLIFDIADKPDVHLQDVMGMESTWLFIHAVALTGALITSVAAVIVLGLVWILYHIVSFFQDRSQDPASTLKVMKESLTTFHNKTCAKLNWRYDEED